MSVVRIKKLCRQDAHTGILSEAMQKFLFNISRERSYSADQAGATTIVNS